MDCVEILEAIMRCEKVQLLAHLLKIKRELKCKEDREMLQIYIERLEHTTSEEIEKELFR